MLRMTKTPLLAALLVSALGTQVAAQDQEAGDIRVDLPARKEPVAGDEPVVRTRRSGAAPGPLRVYGGFNLAVGGELQIEDNPFGDPDLDPTVGLQTGVDYVLHDYFSIGGEMRFLWFKADGGDDRSFLWDLDVKPRGRYAFGNLPLEVYGALPLGLTVPGISGELEGKPGFNIGLLGGANWFFNDRMGVNAEMGWVFHRFKVEADAGFLSTSSVNKMNQFLLLCPNFIYVL